MEDRPVIVGASIAGSFLAGELSKRGVRPIVIEEHAEVGLPFRCAGLVSDRIREVADFPERLILHTAEKAIVNFPDETKVVIEGFEKGCVLDRVNFDKYFYEEAERRGAKFLFNEHFKDFRRKGDGIIVKTDEMKITTRLLIGADGATSKIRKKCGINYGCALAIQVRAELEHDAESVEIFLDKEISAGFFGWIIPETRHVSRIGISDWKNPQKKLSLLLKKIEVEEIIDRQVGLIPICYPKKTCWDNIILVGNAAGQIKASTGGGIVTSMICGKEASNSIIKAYNQGNFSEFFFLDNYEKKWRTKIGKHLKTCYVLAKAVEKLDNADLVELGRLVRRPEILGEINKHGDIDFYTNMVREISRHPRAIIFMLRMAAKHPGLLKHMFKGL